MGDTKPNLDDLRIERREESSSGSKGWIVVVLVLVALAALAGFWWKSNGSVVEVKTVAAKAVSSGGGEGTAAGPALNASGYVTARRQATVSSKVTGKVVEVLLEEGMRVKEGQIVARLDDSNVKTSLAAAKAQWEATRAAAGETQANLRRAELDFKRTQMLAAEKVATQADLDRAEADEKGLRARLGRQQADVTVADRQVQIWEQQLDDMVIRAPFSGVVTTKDAQPGEMISPISGGGRFTRSGIGTIVDMDSLEFEIDVNESYIGQVKAGQAAEARLDAYPDWRIPAKVIAIIPTADRSKSMFKVRVGFERGDPRVLPEMRVSVAFHGDEPKATGATGASLRMVALPKTALIE
ncbi:MAG TPA: efflux RND transporter periplasmic adaptor subunit, partial [Verrucomicrobiae bacterium]|nr:efflux RND transporter periplasmic adaptor subunit [Verrucomicrobiae bacterium]